MPENPTPNWQPIRMLPTIAGIIDGELADAEEHYATLLQAREKPYVLNDEIVDRTIRLHTEQLDFLWVYQEQLVLWRQSDQDPRLREEIDRLAGQIGRLHTALTNILTLRIVASPKNLTQNRSLPHSKSYRDYLFNLHTDILPKLSQSLPHRS